MEEEEHLLFHTILFVRQQETTIQRQLEHNQVKAIFYTIMKRVGQSTVERGEETRIIRIL